MRVDAVVWLASSELVGGHPKPSARDAKASPVLAWHGCSALRQQGRGGQAVVGKISKFLHFLIIFPLIN